MSHLSLERELVGDGPAVKSRRAPLWHVLTMLAGVVLLAGCSDPEQSAEKALLSAQAEWTDARKNLDPAKRTSAYKDIIAEVENVGEKYKKTELGQAVAAGRNAGGVSIANMKSEYDRLAQRSECYAKPTVECLEPFASSGRKYQATSAGSAGNAVHTAIKLVCDKKFADAEEALETLSINRPAHAAGLVQVAIAAAQCDRPDAVRQAMTAYLASEPSQGAQRVNALQSVLADMQLRDAWPHLMPELEQAAASLPENQKAGVDLTLAQRYASLGDAEKALGKFKYVTDELGYSVDINTRLDVAASLLANGHVDAAFALVDDQRNADDLRMNVMHRATQELGGRVGVIRAAGSPNANLPVSGPLTAFYAPVDAETKIREGAAADMVETALDEFVAAHQPNGQHLGMIGADAAYARLALIQQKLGNPEKANALVDKAEGARQSMLPRGAYDPNAQSYAGEFEVLVAIGQGDTERAAAWLPRVTPTGNDVPGHVLHALARAGKAEQALTLATQINRAGANTYQSLINELAAHGHVEQAERVFNAYPGDAQTKSALAWGMVERAAAAGKMKEARKLAETHALLNVPAYKLRMIELNADEAIANKDRKKAETAIREMFTLGEEIDQRAAAERSRAFYAQNAARKAFAAGYTDLGIELYTAATAKDQRPFFDAFTEHSSRSDFPRVLMAAHDNVSGDELSYVIDAAIRGLENN